MAQSHEWHTFEAPKTVQISERSQASIAPPPSRFWINSVERSVQQRPKLAVFSFVWATMNNLGS